LRLAFWPSFVRFEGYVLRDGFSVESLRGFEKLAENNRISVEATMNHIHIADLHCNVEPTEEQLRYLGRTLRDMWQVKLARDFPALRFQVQFNDEPSMVLDEYELTFWQTN
jgi:hypothetical protein